MRGVRVGQIKMTWKNDPTSPKFDETYESTDPRISNNFMHKRNKEYYTETS